MSELSKVVSEQLAYQPQVNTPAEDDPDNYMLLTFKKKRPVLQIACAVLSTSLAIIGLWKDEMSDGDVHFVTEPVQEDDFLDEVDYDCGWNSFRVNYWYFEDEDKLGDGNQHWAEESYIYQYQGSFCNDYNRIVDLDFCTDSQRNGKIWLGTGVVGVISVALSIPVVWFQGKASVWYPSALGMGILMLSIGSMNWLINDKCEDIEDWPEEDVTFETSIGPSLILVFISIFFAIIGILISSIHILTPRRQRRRQEKEQAQQPRIQTHVVLNQNQ